MARSQAHLLYRFRQTARDDFERRMARVCTDYADYLDNPTRRGARHDIREIAATLMEMTQDERFVLLRRVIHDASGPKTLEGMEALSSFVGNYLLDDSACKVVREPDAEDLDDDPSFTTTLGLLRGEGLGVDEATLRIMAVEAYRERDRPLVVVPAGDEAKAGPFELLAAIEHNRAMEARRRQAFEDAIADGPESPRP